MNACFICFVFYICNSNSAKQFEIHFGSKLLKKRKAFLSYSPGKQKLAKPGKNTFQTKIQPLTPSHTIYYKLFIKSRERRHLWFYIPRILISCSHLYLTDMECKNAK